MEKRGGRNSSVKVAGELENRKLGSTFVGRDCPA